MVPEESKQKYKGKGKNTSGKTAAPAAAEAGSDGIGVVAPEVPTQKSKGKGKTTTRKTAAKAVTKGATKSKGKGKKSTGKAAAEAVVQEATKSKGKGKEEAKVSSQDEEKAAKAATPTATKPKQQPAAKRLVTQTAAVDADSGASQLTVKSASEKKKPNRTRDLMKSRKFWSLFEAHELHPDAMTAFKEIEAAKNVEGSNYREKMTELIMSTFKRDESNRLVYYMSGPLYTETRSRAQSGYREGKVEGVLFRKGPLLIFLVLLLFSAGPIRCYLFFCC